MRPLVLIDALSSDGQFAGFRQGEGVGCVYCIGRSIPLPPVTNRV